MRSTTAVAAAVATPAAIGGVVVAAVLWVVGAPLPLVLVPAAATAVLVAAWLWLTAPQSALRALRARPIVLSDHPRLENLLEGLCTTHGFQEPVVHMVETDAVNAASVGLGRPRDHLVVTRGALAGLDRLELEAVVARLLCEIRRGVDSATVLASVARLPASRLVTGPLRGRVLDQRSATEVDIEAVRLTGYPPALASALRKAIDAPRADAASPAAHLWMAAPEGAAPTALVQPSTIQRIDTLGEV